MALVSDVLSARVLSHGWHHGLPFVSQSCYFQAPVVEDMGLFGSADLGSDVEIEPIPPCSSPEEEGEEEVQSDPDDVEESDGEIAVARKKPAAARPPMSKKDIVSVLVCVVEVLWIGCLRCICFV